MAIEMHEFCDFPFTKIKVAPDGGISNCCFQPNGKLGNILKQSFEEIWDGQLVKEIRRVTAEKKMHPACCSYNCPYLYKDKVPFAFLSDRYPTKLEIDIPSSECNIGGTRPSVDNPACLMCRRNASNWKPDGTTQALYASLGKLKFLMDHLRVIHVQGIAEPFFRNHVFQILESLGFASHKNRIMLTTLTNGTLLHEDNRRRFFEACPYCELGFSIDAATPETYVKLRRADCYDKVIEYLRCCISERGERQLVWITHNINTLNVHETELMVETAAEVQADLLQMYPTARAHNECDSILVNQQNCYLFAKAQERAIRRAEELGVRLEFLCPLAAQFEPNLCEIKLA